MKALNKFIQKQNEWNAMFNAEQFEIKTAYGRKRVAERLDSCLSPENLSCDGELPRAEVQRRYKELTAAANELIKLDPSVIQYMYEFNWSN